MDIEQLLPLLRSHGVTHYKHGGLTLTLALKESPQEPGVNPLVEALKKQEESLPPDFRANDLMNEDKVLFYSSPGQGEDTKMPLTEETEI